MTPLRRLLARQLLSLQLPLVALLLGLVWWGSRSLLLGLAHREGEGRLQIAVQALDQRLGAVERAGHAIRTLWGQGRLPFADPAGNAALLMPWLYHQNELRLVNLLEEDRGRSLLLMRTETGWRGRAIRRGDLDQLQLGWQKLGPAGFEGDLPFGNSKGYDARQRGWYQEARLLDAPRWSRPYRLGPPEYRLVMTWLMPLRGPDGSPAGALGIDLVPEDLQGLLDLLRPTPGSRLWLLDQQGLVLSSAHGAGPEAALPPSGDRATVGGLACRVLRREVPRHAGSQWHMVLAIPERDMLAAAQGRLLGITAATFVLLLLPILWGLWVGRRLANDIRNLARAAEEVGAGLVPHLPSHGVSEFQTLGQALERAHAQIQDRVALQKQLQHSQRLETLGTLAGGIAHDVNNHLSAILGQAYLVRETLPEDHPSHGRLKQVEEAATSCARTTRTLLAFSRHGNSDLQPMNLNDLLCEMADLLRGLLGGLVRVELDLDPDLGAIRGDRLQLEQVIMNLAVNARDAMPQGGPLSFRTQGGAEGSVVLTVKDAGTGIPPEILGRIFEPFFTTKAVGKGTGLGLAMVHGIVQSHGGRLEVESVEGQGTTFTLVFPGGTSQVQAPGPMEPLAPQPRDPLAGLRILVAEDETYLLEALVDALQVAGAHVEGAANGEAAWLCLQERPFDCVLSDQRMPGCTGLDLFRRIRAAGSGVPFILASGQDLEPFRGELTRDARFRLLTKPFPIARLVALVQELGWP